MSDKMSEECRCEHWPACNKCLREEIDRLKACEHKGCTDKDIHHICDTHMNTDYPCERCKELEAEVKRMDEYIADIECPGCGWSPPYPPKPYAPKPKEAGK